MFKNKTWTWIVTSSEAGAELRRLLVKRYGFSRRQLLRMRHHGQATLNGQSVPLVQVASAGDLVRVELAEERPGPQPEPIRLDIIWEGEDFTIVNKAAGLVSHPTRGYPGGTLANALAWRWQSQGLERPARLVTRLDKDTSGLVLVAHSAWAHHALARSCISKEYLAITRGIPAPERGEISAALRRVGGVAGRAVVAHGKPAQTSYQLVATTDQNLALVRLQPKTGRTHQLRLHMAHIGCPLVDDYLYGQDDNLVGRVALHAACLKFCDPSTGVQMEFAQVLPEDMAAYFPGY